MKGFRALQREWYAKARASGFNDIENEKGCGLSGRGNPHPVNDTRDEWAHLANRMQDGASYTSWAEAILTDARFPSREARECWRLHAEGRGEADIATALTITRWRVREHLAETRRRVSEVSEVKRWRDAKKQRLLQLRRLVKQTDPDTLTSLVALMLGQGLRSRSA